MRDDLSLENLEYFAKTIPNLLEDFHWYALISEAIYMGMENTIRSLFEKVTKTKIK